MKIRPREAADQASVRAFLAELTAVGYRARQPPFDAFWGARFAIVADPDGNDVGLMSPDAGIPPEMAAAVIARSRSRRA